MTPTWPPQASGPIRRALVLELTQLLDRRCVTDEEHKAAAAAHDAAMAMKAAAQSRAGGRRA